MPPLGDGGENRPPLLVAAIERDGPGAESLQGKDEVGQRRVTRQRLADQAERPDVERVPAAAEPGRHHGAEPPRLTQPACDVPAGLVEVGAVNRRAELARGPAIQLVRQPPMLVVEERPGEEAPVRHQSPSKTGVVRAANAR